MLTKTSESPMSVQGRSAGKRAGHWGWAGPRTTSEEWTLQQPAFLLQRGIEQH